MVLIPLLVLFLIGMQISIAVHGRDTLRISAQDEASKKAISGSFENGDEFMHIDSSGDGQNLDLLIVRKEGRLINLIPHFLNGEAHSRRVEVNGFAIVENQR
jgi:hypothetical protein